MSRTSTWTVGLIALTLTVPGLAAAEGHMPSSAAIRQCQQQADRDSGWPQSKQGGEELRKSPGRGPQDREPTATPPPPAPTSMGDDPQQRHAAYVDAYEQCLKARGF
jgi:hypothetical protein